MIGHVDETCGIFKEMREQLFVLESPQTVLRENNVFMIDVLLKHRLSD